MDPNGLQEMYLFCSGLQYPKCPQDGKRPMRSHYEKHHPAGLNRGLRHPAALMLFAHSLYFTTFRFTYTLPYCLFARMHTRSYFFCNQLLPSSGVVAQTLEVLIFPFYFFSLTNPNNINFRVRSIVQTSNYNQLTVLY